MFITLHKMHVREMGLHIRSTVKDNIHDSREEHKLSFVSFWFFVNVLVNSF